MGGSMSGEKLLSLQIEKRNKVLGSGTEYCVYQIFEYGSSSVLAGSIGRRYRGAFDTVADAKSKFPDADAGGLYESTELPREAPAGYYGSAGGFYDAGEYWSEEDY
jgi:hypothetical protein